MKKGKVFLTISMVFITTTVLAIGNLQLKILPIDAEKAMVNISVMSGNDFQVSITNEIGQMIYYQEINGLLGGCRKIYNFSELEDGLYQMKVVCDAISTERTFEKKRNQILIGAEKTVQKPFFRVDRHILWCTYLNFNQNNVFLHIYGKEVELFSKELGSNFSIQHALDISKLKKGAYEAVLTAGDQQFACDIDVE